jgi:carbon storage regulator CsrA
MGEQIRIGADVVITVVRVDHDRVRIGITAPDDMVILREEVLRRQEAERRRHGGCEAVPARLGLPVGSVDRAARVKPVAPNGSIKD